MATKKSIKETKEINAEVLNLNPIYQTNSFKEAVEICTAKEADTLWNDCLVKETEAFGISYGNDISIEEIDGIVTSMEGNFHIDSSLDVSRDCAKNSALFLKTPYAGESLKTFPIRMCSVMSLLEVLGVNCPVMRTFEETRSKDIFSPTMRADVINKAIHIYKSKGFRMAVKKSTSEIRAIHSENYCPIPEIALLNAIESNGVNVTLKHFIMDESYTYMIFTYDNKEVIEKIASELNGTDFEGFVPAFHIATSDIGSEAVSIAPALYRESDGKFRPFTSEKLMVKIKHVGKFENNILKFEETLASLFKIFETTLEEIVALKKVAINNPITCFKNVAIFGLGLGKKEVAKYCDSDEFNVPRTAFHLYTELFNLGKPDSQGFDKVKEMETIGLFLSNIFPHLEEYDIPTIMKEAK